MIELGVLFLFRRGPRHVGTIEHSHRGGSPAAAVSGVLRRRESIGVRHPEAERSEKRPGGPHRPHFHSSSTRPDFKFSSPFHPVDERAPLRGYWGRRVPCDAPRLSIMPAWKPKPSLLSRVPTRSRFSRAIFFNLSVSKKLFENLPRLRQDQSLDRDFFPFFINIPRVNYKTRIKDLVSINTRKISCWKLLASCEYFFVIKTISRWNILIICIV